MLWYWILFLIVLFFCIIDFFKISIRIVYKKIILISMLALLGLFAGLRYECDNDYLEYVRIYNQVPSMREFFAGGYNLSDIYGEPLFVLTNIIFKTLGAADYIYLSFIAFLNLYFLYKSIVGFSKYWFLSLFLYLALMYLGGGFTQIRFGVATTLGWYALLQYLNGRFKYSVLLLCCAIMFHISAVSLVIVYVAHRVLKLNTISVSVICGLSILITFFSLNDLFGRILGVWLGDSRYEVYLNAEVYTEKANSFSTYFYCINILIFWFFRSQILQEFGHTRYSFLLNVGLMSLFFGAFFNQMAILSRFGLILQFCFIFILPLTFGLRPIRLFMLASLICYGFFRYRQFLGKDSFIQEYQNIIVSKWIKR